MHFEQKEQDTKSGRLILPFPRSRATGYQHYYAKKATEQTSGLFMETFMLSKLQPMKSLELFMDNHDIMCDLFLCRVIELIPYMGKQYHVLHQSSDQ